jgi:16S rRNA (uracil1498-N3)-methyltransferase
MARRRFFVPEIRRGMAELTGHDAEHLVRVLRAERGQVYEISDNQNLYLAEVEVARKSLVSFRVLERLDRPIPVVQVVLFAALIKFERFEWLIEKATELGVSAIEPIESSRTERGLAEAAQKRVSRWQKIVVEASQQSRRVHLPRVGAPVRLAKALQTTAKIRLALDEGPEVRPMLERLPLERSLGDQVAVLVGPEGGWTDEERAAFMEAGWAGCSLGRTILRAETAAVAGLAIIQAAWAQSPHAPGATPPESL